MFLLLLFLFLVVVVMVVVILMVKKEVYQLLTISLNKMSAIHSPTDLESKFK